MDALICTKCEYMYTVRHDASFREELEIAQVAVIDSAAELIYVVQFG